MRAAEPPSGGAGARPRARSVGSCYWYLGQRPPQRTHRRAAGCADVRRRMRHPDDVHPPAGWLAALQHASWVMPSQLHDESRGERAGASVGHPAPARCPGERRTTTWPRLRWGAMPLRPVRARGRRPLSPRPGRDRTSRRARDHQQARNLLMDLGNVPVGFGSCAGSGRSVHGLGRRGHGGRGYRSGQDPAAAAHGRTASPNASS